MPFKFRLLSLEFSKCNLSCESKKQGKKTMASKKLTPQQKKFKTAQSKCHSETDSPKSFGRCMSEKLTKKKTRGKK